MAVGESHAPRFTRTPQSQGCRRWRMERLVQPRTSARRYCFGAFARASYTASIPLLQANRGEEDACTAV